MLFRSVLIAFEAKCFLVQMNRGQRSRAALSGDARLTAGASSSTARGGDDDKNKENLRKKCQRKGVEWCKRYFEKYNIFDPNLIEPDSLYWLHFADSVLQETFDYHNGDSAGLQSLLNLINTQSGNSGFWPAEASKHDLYHAIKKIIGSGSK